ncbi:uncharacterized protein C9orf43 homolog isoform X3 [Cavia porcellus]|uniref:uncharacterized protein C9orf43 homolog isoform X3 n=1 Tax=Cavia porcellus TaxID=10141 RepID=UPI0006618BF6|nr:uncharacterized protein C9orf43 homolog isoform X3 [Cavia porcellus]
MAAMVLPDDSQWDETTCDLAVCPHPQCWAAVRRIERGHPRIRSSPCKTPVDAEDKLPGLTVVNISDSCFQARRLAHQQSPEFAFTKAHSLLSQGSKLASKFQGRTQKGLPEKNLINYPKRFPKESHKKLSVLNLNETQLPCSEDVRNMVVIWIPEELGKNVYLPEKTSPLPSQNGKQKRKESARKTESSKTPGKAVPPPSPVRASEDLSSEMPIWAHNSTLPQNLLKELLPHGENNMPCPEMKIQLDRMKKSLPLEKNRPDSAISSKMFLTIHRLTLQRPTLQYPEHRKKLHSTLKREDYRKQQQWQQLQEKKEKNPPKEQKAKKKAKSEQGIQNTSQKHSAAVACNPLCGIELTTSCLPGQESDMKQQQQQMKTEGATLEPVSIESSRNDHSDKFLGIFPDRRGSKMSMMELPCKDVNASVEMVLEAPAANQEKIPEDLTENVAEISWKPELQLLRILQDTDVEEEVNQPSVAESEDSWDT